MTFHEPDDNMCSHLSQLTEVALKQLVDDSFLSKYVDFDLHLPKAVKGKGIIRLIILGQDPTVGSLEQRRLIKSVLDDPNGLLQRYLKRICFGLDLTLDQDVYVTNLIKNFFLEPPARYPKKVKDEIFRRATPIWWDALMAELEQFPDTPVISLGKPVLASVVKRGKPYDEVAFYWNHSRYRNPEQDGEFRYSDPEDNKTNRLLFPFPHITTGTADPFYKQQFPLYQDYTRQVVHTCAS